MGSSSNEPFAIRSSIALLQERFRKLQRVKEMREGRELSKALAEPKRYNPTEQHQPDSSLFFQPEAIVQPRPPPPPHVSLSLWPDPLTQIKQQDARCVEAPAVLMMSLWPGEKQANNNNNNKHNNLLNRFDDPASDDIDTSLHL